MKPSLLRSTSDYNGHQDKETNNATDIQRDCRERSASVFIVRPTFMRPKEADNGDILLYDHAYKLSSTYAAQFSSEPIKTPLRRRFRRSLPAFFPDCQLFSGTRSCSDNVLATGAPCKRCRGKSHAIVALAPRVTGSRAADPASGAKAEYMRFSLSSSCCATDGRTSFRLACKCPDVMLADGLDFGSGRLLVAVSLPLSSPAVAEFLGSADSRVASVARSLLSSSAKQERRQSRHRQAQSGVAVLVVSRRGDEVRRMEVRN